LAEDGPTRFRVRAYAISGGGTLVVAIPLTDVTDTLSRLVRIEVVVTAVVLTVLGALAWWLVRLGLRPLERMGQTAGAIAAGDLSRRVEPADPRTEVGRLGIALNAMLERIERAFAERQASEERLRRFVADASHELRTPLTSVQGYAELFRRGAANDPEALRTAMWRIEEEGARMGALDELSLLARLDQGRPLTREPVDRPPSRTPRSTEPVWPSPTARSSWTRTAR
jgi:two-component system OmpR family sensor kinase